MACCTRFDGDRRYLTELPSPGTISEIAIFLLPGASIPTGLGGAFRCAGSKLSGHGQRAAVLCWGAVTVYFSFPPYSGWDVLGVLTADSPSAIFRTNWPATPEFAACSLVQVRYCGHSCVRICCIHRCGPCNAQIGLSIEPAGVVNNLQQVLGAKEHDKMGIGALVARDLFT
jgi:hypothetical protein